jgi:hypothetical protein
MTMRLKEFYAKNVQTACVICSFDSVSTVASVNLIFKSLQKKKIMGLL